MGIPFDTYARWSITPQSAKGSYIYDEDGKCFLDFTSGIAVVNLGHCHPHVQAALKDQIDKLWHTSNLFQSPLQQKCAALLTENTHFDRVFFCNSGAEANEAAIKLARKATGKSKIISFQQSFHGRTFATMSATGQSKIHDGFGPLLGTFVHLPYNDMNAFQQALDNDVAAVMLEVIQGEGGVHLANKEWLDAVCALCVAKGVLVIID
ncbi:MAG: aminotransferase class III-fold pyridoxal phosphate-dependent enzyme, partial [Bacilli bacterium]